MSRFRLLTIVSAISVALDQATKLHIDYHFDLHESVPVIPGLFSLTYIRNQGAAFGILSDSSIRVPFFIGVSILAMLGILLFLKKRNNEQKLGNLGLALVFSGAAGNLIDRLRLGEVIDFLDVYWRSYHWPAFNVADSAITVGVALLIYEAWIEEKHKHS
ncbi:MAG TPA: signal peptidase II [Desulfobacteraceae bacterium]|nr:signal peptidase II [Desulfobacteraceae bacterium]